MTEHTEEFEEVQQALELDRVIHEPARLVILGVLSKVEWVDFKFLLSVTGLTKGNLSKQATKLEEAGYIEIEKTFRGKIPLTRYHITDVGRDALSGYWHQMSALQETMNSMNDGEAG